MLRLNRIPWWLSPLLVVVAIWVIWEGRPGCRGVSSPSRAACEGQPPRLAASIRANPTRFGQPLAAPSAAGESPWAAGESGAGGRSAARIDVAAGGPSNGPSPPVIRVSYERDESSDRGAEDPRSYTLRHVDCAEFERRMLEVWGNRLSVASENQGRQVQVVLPTPADQCGMMRIDRERGVLTFQGPQAVARLWKRLMTALDEPREHRADAARILDIQQAKPDTIQKAVSLIQTVGLVGDRQDQETVRRAIPLNPADARAGVVAIPDQEPAAGEGPPGAQDDQQQGLSGTVRIDVIPELNILILNGNPKDVEYVQKVLANLIQTAGAAQPEIEVYPLKNVSGQSIATQVQTLYDANFAPQQGAVSISAIEQPNGVLLIGRRENLDLVKRLIDNLDVASTDQTVQFKTIRLQFMSAIDAKQRLDDYFAAAAAQPQVGGQQQQPSAVTIVADYRTNTLVIKAGTANLALAEQLIAQFDVTDSAAANIVQVFPLRNAVAADLAVVLQDAINGQLQNSGQGMVTQTQGGGGFGGAQNRVQATAPGDASTESRIRSAMLQLKTVDLNGQIVEGGILFDVRITADNNSNSLVVTGPERSMDLIAALVKRLDVIPDVEIKIKVFRLVNGDAATVLTALQALFGSQTQAGGAFNQASQGLSQLPLQTGNVGAGNTLAGLRFSSDTRTNTIIVSGPEGDLQVIEDLLFRLDVLEDNLRSLQVYRLSNAPAADVAEALNEYIDGRQEINDADPSAISPFEQTRREILVIPEIVTNSLLISATPEYFAELEPVIQSLDRRPPMVKVKVLIAQITLDALNEFGVEVGIQDSLLFDRGLSNLRFPFNSSNLGNDNSATSLATRKLLAGQALSNLAVGRTNSNAGFGGLVLSAGNESVNVLIRALQQRNAIRVLADPQVTTIDNLLARIQVGQKVPTVTAVNQTNAGGFSNSVEYTDVGIILEITPRVSPDGTIVMTVNATNSSLGNIDDGIPIFSDANGTIIRSPIINNTTAETTIMARSGQTVVFSGLLQELRSEQRRGIPILSELPTIGPLFRFDSQETQRQELLIVLTPYLLDNENDVELANQVEYDRMHWCLSDVLELHGTLGYGAGGTPLQTIPGETTPLIYPDANPSGHVAPPAGGPNPPPHGTPISRASPDRSVRPYDDPAVERPPFDRLPLVSAPQPPLLDPSLIVPQIASPPPVASGTPITVQR